jgi:hypothetical protein
VSTYERLAAEQHEAAMTGGLAWVRFVARAEGETGLPWCNLREILEPYMRTFYAKLAEPRDA